jgi:hypothetical protein
MPNESRAVPAIDAEAGLEVSPVVVVTRRSPARPSALPDAQAFAVSSLADSDIEAEYLRAVHAAILEAMLLAADSEGGTFDVVVHLYPDAAEVEVLAGADQATTGIAAAADEPFAAWLAQALRRQGLSQEAAARQLGVSVRTVSRWVLGHTEPRMRDMRRIQSVFGRTPLP